MTVSNAKYYLTRHPDSGKPVVLYRFFHDNSKPPEALSELHDWRPESRVRLLRMSGEIGSADVISEQEAYAVAKSWGHDL